MIIFYIIIFISSFVLTWIYRKYAMKRSLLDIPNERSSHTVPTPHGGGLAIAITWFSGLIWLFYNNLLDSSLFYSLLCGIPLVIISFLDDIFILKPSRRFFVQTISSASALFFLDGLTFIDLGIAVINLPLLGTAIAFVAILWAINLFNFLDGIDGYIGSEIVFIGLASFLLIGENVLLLLAITTLGFLFWNWPRAKIFMGDVGSTLLGFNVAVFTIYFQHKDVSIILWLILSSVFWFDASITLVRRIRTQVSTQGFSSLSKAHRQHAYQRITQAGYSHRQTTMGLLSINFVLFLICWIAFQSPNVWPTSLLITLLILWLMLKWIDKKKKFASR